MTLYVFARFADLSPYSCNSSSYTLRLNRVAYLHLFELIEGRVVPARLQVDQTDVSLDLARALVHLAIVVFQDLPCLLQTAQSLIEHLTLFLHLSKFDENAGDDVAVRKLFNLVENIKGFGLIVDRTAHLFGFQVSGCQF